MFSFFCGYVLCQYFQLFPPFQICGVKLKLCLLFHKAMCACQVQLTVHCQTYVKKGFSHKGALERVRVLNRFLYCKLNLEVH